MEVSNASVKKDAGAMDTGAGRKCGLHTPCHTVIVFYTL